MYLNLNAEKFQVAQGDVILTAADPTTAMTDYKRLETPSLTVGKEGVALAWGEKKGHQHALMPMDPTQSIKVHSQTTTGGVQTVTVFETPSEGAFLKHPEHGTIIIPGGLFIVAMAGQREDSPASATGGGVVKAD